jgi:Uma2 family endonuclease
MTYDQGSLELMTPRRQHEQIGRLIGRMIEAFSEVRGIEILSCASTTFKRWDLDRAFEPDESYYIAHADEIRPKDEVDLVVDPPPDLVIEVEITKSAIAKLKLFAAMGVPEVWRHDGDRLTMLTIGDDGYRPIESSIGLPGLSATRIDAFLARRFERGETALITEFREAVAARPAT